MPGGASAHAAGAQQALSGGFLLRGRVNHPATGWLAGLKGRRSAPAASFISVNLVYTLVTRTNTNTDTDTYTNTNTDTDPNTNTNTDTKPTFTFYLSIFYRIFTYSFYKRDIN
jgi:hypothetical protein